MSYRNESPAMALSSRICISLGHHDPDRLLELAHTEARRGELFLEICLEFLADPQIGPDIIRSFMQRWHRSFVIATYRRVEHPCHDSIERQLALLDRAVDAGARGVDLEIESARRARGWLTEIGLRCMRIVSYHNNKSCPSLEPIVHELESFPADIIKVAVRAEKSETIWQLMQLARECNRPNVMLAMGNGGVPTRIIGPVVGRSFTYAAQDLNRSTADGQLDARTLREVYHLDNLDSETEFILDIVGKGDAVLSAKRFNQALADAGINAVYIPWSSFSEHIASLKI
jgi:3-dehydroquinate dehydratase/shikimate dehydrogenase